MRADLRLYALVDPERAAGHPLDDLAHAVADGGASLIQLRDKLGETRAMVETARAIKSALGGRAPLLINDRVDVALAARADGVHLGQEDMAAIDARRLLGPHALIGLSIKTIAQAEAAPIEFLDYVCVGGVFATSSKDNREPPIGVEGFRAILSVLRERTPDLPVGAIAGIDASNAGELIEAGADGVAVISALSLTSDPAAAARGLRGVVDSALARRASR
jgi:thiamine-phosphate pyrophosphorylase